jgi:hypothetical protein
MPVIDLAEARDVDEAIEKILSAADTASAFQAARSLFVELLDFTPATGPLTLSGPGLPATVTRLAQRGGTHVLGLELPSEGRVRAADLRAALRQLRELLAGDLLLVTSCSSGSNRASRRFARRSRCSSEAIRISAQPSRPATCLSVRLPRQSSPARLSIQTSSSIASLGRKPVATRRARLDPS